MCIIVAKRRGIELPAKETLENCFKRNDDGAGYMYNHRGKVYGRKGFMTFDEFYADLMETQERVGGFFDKGVVLHFRIGTHGTNNPQNTHPFPLTSDYHQMKALRWVSKQGFAHNGIIYQTSRHEDIKTKDVSDTMVFNRYYVAPVSKHADVTKDDELLHMFETLCHGKLAFLNGKGIVSTCGHFIESDGILYSNTTYMPYVYTKKTNLAPYNYGDWDYDYDYMLPYNHGSFTSSVSEFPIDDKVSTMSPQEDDDEVEDDDQSDSVIKEYAADDLDVCIFRRTVVVEFLEGTTVVDDEILPKGYYGYQRETGDIYVWDGHEYTWKCAYLNEDLRVRDFHTGELIVINETA